MLGTETLAATLVRPDAYPALTEQDITEARRRLAGAFQAAWIEECARLRGEAGPS